MDTMNFKCLVLDHDDTTVSSTPCIHYPAFVKILEVLRPGKHYSMEEFLQKNFSPGLWSFYINDLGFTKQELEMEGTIWRSFVADIVPPFFPGMGELIKRQKEAGGFVCVVSHSFPEYIRRDYESANVPLPDLIYGWDSDRSKCKPSPWPLQEIMRITGCKPEEILMVDDLMPGLEMARACGVKFAACGWGYDIQPIHEYMEMNADYVLKKVPDLEKLLFSGEEFCAR